MTFLEDVIVDNGYGAVFLTLVCVTLLNLPEVHRSAAATHRIATHPTSPQNPQSGPYKVEVQVLDEDENPLEGVRVLIRNTGIILAKEYHREARL
jgi:hypothetical protein